MKVANIFVILLISAIALARVEVGTFEKIYYKTGNKMETGTGDRKDVVDVNFTSTYDNPPKVSYSVTRLDIDQGTAVRYVVTIGNITTTGFQTTIGTWADTRVFSIAIAWIASSY